MRKFMLIDDAVLEGCSAAPSFNPSDNIVFTLSNSNRKALADSSGTPGMVRAHCGRVKGDRQVEFFIDGSPIVHFVAAVQNGDCQANFFGTVVADVCAEARQYVIDNFLSCTDDTDFTNYPNAPFGGGVYCDPPFIITDDNCPIGYSQEWWRSFPDPSCGNSTDGGAAAKMLATRQSDLINSLTVGLELGPLEWPIGSGAASTPSYSEFRDTPFFSGPEYWGFVYNSDGTVSKYLNGVLQATSAVISGDRILFPFALENNNVPSVRMSIVERINMTASTIVYPIAGATPWSDYP